MYRFALAALAASAVAGAAAPAFAQGRQCFFTREVNRYADAGPSAIDVRINSQNVYRLTLLGPCPELNSSLGIALDARGRSSVCEGDPGVDLITRDASRRGTTRCPISDISKLSPEEAAHYGQRRR